MARQAAIRLLGDLTVRLEGEKEERLSDKSRMGCALMEYLILQRGRAVPGSRLIRELWTDRGGKNPENALKTMISRLRSLLNGVCAGLGDCVAFGPGGYFWKSQPWVRVDVLDMLDRADRLRGDLDTEERRELLKAITEIYRGDLCVFGDTAGLDAKAGYLRREYMNAVYALMNILREAEEWEQAYVLCSRAMEIDGENERLHMDLLDTMVHMGRMGEAVREYRRLTGPGASAEGDEENRTRLSAKSLSETGKRLKQQTDELCHALTAQEQERQGPFFCDYATFKEFYDIQINNLTRLGATMFLGMVMVAGVDSDIGDVSRESAMAALMEILRRHLRKGDIITRYSPDIAAVLLPGVNYVSGGLVMDRIQRLFYMEYPKGSVMVYHMLTSLGGDMEKEK